MPKPLDLDLDFDGDSDISQLFNDLYFAALENSDEPGLDELLTQDEYDDELGDEDTESLDFEDLEDD
jgi:hypothetical protein